MKKRGWKVMSEVMNVAEIFGKNVFNETVMREYLPKGVFRKLKKTMEEDRKSTRLNSSHMA